MECVHRQVCDSEDNHETSFLNASADARVNLDALMLASVGPGGVSSTLHQKGATRCAVEDALRERRQRQVQIAIPRGEDAISNQIEDLCM